MTNRREFLQTGVSVSALPLAINGLLSPTAARASAETKQVFLDQAIFDDRYAEGRVFAEGIGEFGVPVHALQDGDVTGWYEELDLLWRERPAVIAGWTQFGPMFVLEQLGREHGLRVALRVEHQVRVDGTLAHAMTGAPETLALAEQLRLRRVGWPRLIAVLAAHCRADCPSPVHRTITMPGAQPVLTRAAAAVSRDAPEPVIHYYPTLAIQEGRGVPWDGPLFSWVIAPPGRA